MTHNRHEHTRESFILFFVLKIRARLGLGHPASYKLASLSALAQRRPCAPSLVANRPGAGRPRWASPPLPAVSQRRWRAHGSKYGCPSQHAYGVGGCETREHGPRAMQKGCAGERTSRGGQRSGAAEAAWDGGNPSGIWGRTTGYRGGCAGGALGGTKAARCHGLLQARVGWLESALGWLEG